MIRRPQYQLLTAYYEVFEEKQSNAPIGKASVTDGLIDSLMIENGAPEIYYGQILSRLLRTILEDADQYNSNVSIKIAQPESTRLKRFLERFGFSEDIIGIYKRTSGTAIPPGVIY